MLSWSQLIQALLSFYSFIQQILINVCARCWGYTVSKIDLLMQRSLGGTQGVNEWRGLCESNPQSRGVLQLLQGV